MPSVSEVLRQQPKFRMTWASLVGPEGMPDFPNGPGAYAVYGRTRLLYVGRTMHLRRRIGQFIGAACGGPDLHSGGWKLYERWAELAPGQRSLTFDVYPGMRAYHRERELIGTCCPLINGRWARP